jgi:hypothetical protein
VLTWPGISEGLPSQTEKALLRLRWVAIYILQDDPHSLTSRHAVRGANVGLGYYERLDNPITKSLLKYIARLFSNR